MDVVAALLAKAELLLSTEPGTEVHEDDGEEELFPRAALSDYVVAVVSDIVAGLGAEMWPAEADDGKTVERGSTGRLNCEERIVPVAQQRAGARPRRGQTLRRFLSRAWTGAKQAGRLFCCCGRRRE